ncbi:MAG: 4-hydroxybutyryl-CoA dehydratase [Deltaproteobacteria bacterium]|nr:4-hydroxybutyryl-CoA dehydratase [Deltaproteobacteria bacterium]
MPLMTGDQYRDSIRKIHRNSRVYIGGEKISNPLDHPIVIPAQNTAAMTYELAQDPEYVDLMTAYSPYTGSKVNRFTHIYQSIDDMVKKVKMARMLGQKTATCFQRCTTLDTANALFIVTYQMDKKLGTEYHKRFLTFLKEMQENDYHLGVAMTDAKGDRSLRPIEQPDPDAWLHVAEEKSDGIVIRGAKTSQTGSANAHYTFVAPTAAIRKGEEDYAVAAAVPTDAEGLYHIYGRNPGDDRKYEPNVMDMGNPKFSSQETLMVFDNVFVPWEKVFLYKEVEFAGRIPFLFGANHRQTYGGCKAGVSDVLIGAVKLIAEYTGIDKIPHIRDKITDMVTLTETIYSCGLATALEGEKMETGSYFVNQLLGNVCKLNVAELPFKIARLAVDICGGVLGDAPSGKDLLSPEIGKFVEKYMKGVAGVPTENRMRLLYLVQSLLFGFNSVGYVVESLHGAGPPQAQKSSLYRLVDFEHKKNLAKNIANIKD